MFHIKNKNDKDDKYFIREFLFSFKLKFKSNAKVYNKNKYIFREFSLAYF